MAVLRLIYTLYLRLVAVTLLGLVATLVAAQAGYLDMGDSRPVPVWVLAIAIAVGLQFLIPWWQPYGLWKPGRRTDAVWVLPHSVVCAVLPFLLRPFLALPFVPERLAAFPFDPVWTAIFPALLISALIVPRVRGGGKRADMKNRASRRVDGATSPDPVQTARTATPESRLPAIGAAMKLYVAADWLILRLMGIGLLAVAWMLHHLVGQGRDNKALSLTHGQDPQIAMWLVAALGLALAVPVLLPRAIARPHHVVGGMAKSVILVVAALVLIEPLQMAILTWAPKVYHQALLVTVPKLFRAIAGVAITSVLLVSFFRQLGTLPTADTADVPVMGGDDLREMRQARMG